ncbi:irregular chiasm C-roughest protein teiresias [Megachile rotundata]|uniref:irregular chiasm C-roughest protein teiresias n=1 Tax=Megachile rotundata TaxID=143995 RepID=UPI003FD3EE5D
MGCSSGYFFLATLLVGGLLQVILFSETHASRLRQRSGPTDTPRGGSVNEAGVFTLRGRQEGGRRGRRTTTSTTSTTTSSPTLISLSDEVAQPAALLAHEEDLWSTSSSATTNVPLSLDTAATPSKPPLEMMVKFHSKLILPCELEANYSRLLLPGATRSYRTRPATWLHDGSPVDMITINTKTEMSGTGHRYIGDSITAELHIDNVRLEDDGIWSCTIENDQGEILAGRPVKLVVLDAPRGTYLLIDGRRLDPGNQFVPVKEGSELTLQCAAEGGNPPPDLAWEMTLSQATLDGPEQLPGNLTVLPSTSDRHSGAHLTVLRGHHNATITCVARHVTLPMPVNASILLDVQYTPSFAITRLPGFGIPIVEGMSVSMKCEVDSNPASTPIWQRDNGRPIEQGDDGWLNFTKITRTDSAWYKCYTKHKLGIFTSIGYFLNVRYDPDMEMEAEALNGEATDSRKMEVQIGGAVTLECDGGCWGHGPGMEPVGGPGRLNLSRVVYQEAGEYRCVAPDRKMQDRWRAQLPYHINVTGRPMVYPPSQTVTAKEGEPLNIIVKFCAKPRYTKVFWMSEENVYVPGAPARDGVQAIAIEDEATDSCYRTVLSFDTIQWSHAGEWLLLVRSSEGITDASVLLNVTRASEYSHAHFRSTNLTCLSFCLLLLTLREYRR